MEDENKEQTLLPKLLEIQRDLKVEKGQYNSFSDFNYRSKEDILEAVKPLAHDHGCVVTLNDGIHVTPNGWVYVKATATLTDADTGESVSASSFAREPKEKKKMDDGQITGMASSYAGKRALGNLFALDDTADADSYEPKQEKQPPAGQDYLVKCRSCGAVYQMPAGDDYTKYGCTCGHPDFEVC